LTGGPNFFKTGQVWSSSRSRPPTPLVPRRPGSSATTSTLARPPALSSSLTFSSAPLRPRASVSCPTPPTLLPWPAPWPRWPRRRVSSGVSMPASAPSSSSRSPTPWPSSPVRCHRPRLTRGQGGILGDGGLLDKFWPRTLSLCTHQPYSLGNLVTLPTCDESAVGISRARAIIPRGASPLKAPLVDV
jgi:hypothetical protein